MSCIMHHLINGSTTVWNSIVVKEIMHMLNKRRYITLLMKVIEVHKDEEFAATFHFYSIIVLLWLLRRCRKISM